MAAPTRERRGVLTPATKDDVNGMGNAIMLEFLGMKNVLPLMANKLGITDAEFDEAVKPPEEATLWPTE